MVKLVARRGDKLIFYSAGGSDICDRAFGVVLFYRPGDGKCGIYMAARSAARHKYSHLEILFVFLFFLV